MSPYIMLTHVIYEGPLSVPIWIKTFQCEAIFVHQMTGLFYMESLQNLTLVLNSKRGYFYDRCCSEIGEWY